VSFEGKLNTDHNDNNTLKPTSYCKPQHTGILKGGGQSASMSQLKLANGHTESGDPELVRNQYGDSPMFVPKHKVSTVYMSVSSTSDMNSVKHLIHDAEF